MDMKNSWQKLTPKKDPLKLSTLILGLLLGFSSFAEEEKQETTSATGTTSEFSYSFSSKKNDDSESTEYSFQTVIEENKYNVVINGEVFQSVHRSDLYAVYQENSKSEWTGNDIANLFFNEFFDDDDIITGVGEGNPDPGPKKAAENEAIEPGTLALDSSNPHFDKIRGFAALQLAARFADEFHLEVEFPKTEPPKKKGKGIGEGNPGGGETPGQGRTTSQWIDEAMSRACLLYTSPSPRD